MKPLRALVVYESMFGHTEQLAHAVAEGLADAGVTVTLTEVSEAPFGIPREVDLLVVGAPTHAFSLSRPNTRSEAVRKGALASRQPLGLREWLSSVSGTNGVGVAVFDTRRAKVRRLPLAAGPLAAKIARRRGLVLLSKPVGFVVNGTKGPLRSDQLERAAAWGSLVADVARGHVVVTERARQRVS
ncbi:MAG TPA: flavodoxin domain-containing protein [Nocardioides sp.]|nr:flavodoxin domain-containing protein [Nocardioides sp.]